MTACYHPRLCDRAPANKSARSVMALYGSYWIVLYCINITKSNTVSWNCYDRRTRFVVIWKHFCFILSTGIRIRIDSVMRPRSSSRGAQYKCLSYSYSTLRRLEPFECFLVIYLFKYYLKHRVRLIETCIFVEQRRHR